MTLQDIRIQLSVQNENVRREAVQALSLMSGGEALSLLVHAMGDADWRVRKTAVEVICDHFVNENSLIPDLLTALRSEDNAGMRNSAAAVLTRMGRAAVFDLKKALKDPDKDLRKYIVDILGDIGDGADGLVEVLSDADDNVRSAAAEALGKIGTTEVIDALVSLLSTSEKDIWLCFSILEALGKIGSGIPTSPIIKLLDSELLRKPVYEALGRSGDPDVIPYLIEGFKDKRRTNRETAMLNYVMLYNSLSKDGKLLSEDMIVKSADISLIAEYLDSESNPLKKCAITVIGQKKAVEYGGRILSLASDEGLQDIITRALINMGAQGPNILMDAFGSSQDKMRSYICTVLGKTGDGRVLKTLLLALNDNHGHTRQKAAKALGELGFVDAVTPLISILTDPYEDVIEASVKALVAIGRVKKTTVISQVLERIVTKDTRLRKYLTIILGEIGDISVLPSIISSIKDEDSEMRKTAALALGSLGLVEGLDHLAIALADEESQVRLASTHALARFSDPEAQRLLTLAAHDEDIWVKCAALKNLSGFENEKSAEVLKDAVKDEIGIVAISAMESLYAVSGKRAEDTIKVMLNHDDPEVIRTAHKLLSMMAE